jgi:intracellular multiplication protein IcmL
MAEDGLNVVVLENNYYRDRFGKVIFVICLILVAILFLVAIAIYNYINKPPPVTFHVAEEWRVMAPVPKDQPYLTNPEVLQWVSIVIPAAFNVDFLQLDAQVAKNKQYFTDNGYQVYLNQLNNYVDRTMLQSDKMFVHSKPTSAPLIVDKGVLIDRYAWKVQMPINISYAGTKKIPEVNLMLQVLVVRTDTSNNLTGILIDNIIVNPDKIVGSRQ